MPHTPNEPWKFPDGRQLTATTLNAMDMTPGDMDTILCALRIDHNPDAMRDMGLRGGALLSGNAEDGHNNMLAEERHRQQIDQANDRFDQERREQIQQQQMDARRAKEEAERRWAEEHRADQEQANRNLIAIPVALGGFALGLGLLPGAMDAAGEAMEGSVSALHGSMMVTSNNGGGQLAAARGGFDIMGPGADGDVLVTGPNNAMNFTPGQAAPAAAPAAIAPQRTPNAFKLPGMDMPTLNPPMGS